MFTCCKALVQRLTCHAVMDVQFDAFKAQWGNNPSELVKKTLAQYEVPDQCLLVRCRR
jgi:hypothetical protein